MLVSSSSVKNVRSVWVHYNDMMTGSTIPKEFEFVSLVFSVAVTVSHATICTFGNMALSIPRNRSKNNYFPININNYYRCEEPKMFNTQLFCNIHFLIFFLGGGGGGGGGGIWEITYLKVEEGNINNLHVHCYPCKSNTH